MISCIDTCTGFSISFESRFANAYERTNIIDTLGIGITVMGVGSTLINVCSQCGKGVTKEIGTVQNQPMPTFLCTIPVQVWPSPSYPSLQVQVYEPGTLVQSALESQSSRPAAHSLISAVIITNHHRLNTGKNSSPILIRYTCASSSISRVASHTVALIASLSVGTLSNCCTHKSPTGSNTAEQVSITVVSSITALINIYTQ